MPTRFRVGRLQPAGSLKNHGFTLIELLVIIVIGGILAAIALPFFLSRANAARQVEAKVIVSNLNRAQHAYFTEHAQFTDSLAALGIPASNSGNYGFSVALQKGGLYAIHYADSQAAKLHPYVGMTAFMESGSNSSIQTILCEGDSSAQGKANDPVYSDTVLSCGSGSHILQ